MVYVGDPMIMCPSHAFDFSNTWAVVVSGDFPNPCGHLILNTGGWWGYYFHVAGGVHDYPRFMNARGYSRYLREAAKQEKKRFWIPVPNPSSAMLKLEELLAAKWTWGILPHNCASFVEEIVRAGGSPRGLYSNCPNLEDFD